MTTLDSLLQIAPRGAMKTHGRLAVGFGYAAVAVGFDYGNGVVGFGAFGRFVFGQHHMS